MSLKKLRRQIDNLDKKIILSLNQRTKITLGVARLKRLKGKSIYSPDRERQILDKLAVLNKGPLSRHALEAIYREIMSASLSIDKALKIAFLGPEASFTHLAALKRFGSQVKYVASKSISEVFIEVERGSCDYGVVPIENSIEGAVSHTLDMFADSDLKICSQIILDVAHNLLSKYPKEKIKKVYSNPQVFGQCRLWLQENLPNAELVEASSTTRASQIAANEKYSAAIASLLAAKVYRLKAIAKDIEDSLHNVTRFLVIGNSDVAKTNRDKTSILFSIKDKIGALHTMLLPFKKYRINLTKIESRPSKKKAWDYYFFIDLEGHRDDKRVKKAIRELENQCTFLKVLGSYPVGE